LLQKIQDLKLLFTRYQTDLKNDFDDTYGKFKQQSQDMNELYSLKVDGEISRRSRHYHDVSKSFSFVEQRIDELHSKTKGFMDLQYRSYKSVK
jgi:hypothetical protein